MRYSLVLYTVYTELCMVTFDKVCFDNVCLLRVFPMVETAKRCIYIGTAATLCFVSRGLQPHTTGHGGIFFC